MPAPKVRIITNAVSEGANSLQAKLRELGVDVSRVRVSNAPKRPSRTNIKWGCFNMNPTDFGGPVAWNVHAGQTTLDKLLCFNALNAAGVPIPLYTSQRHIAEAWFNNAPDPRKIRVYERHVLRGSEGNGIEVRESVGELTDAPLYVKGMRGVRREYRIHVFAINGVRRVFIQQKKRRQGFAEAAGYTNLVRNLEGGWIFAHNDIVAPRQQTIDIAVAAVNATNLQFGAVDVIEMNDVTQGSVVLEINCAPGLMGATCEFYATAIKAVLDGVVDTAPATVGVDEDGIPVDEDDQTEDYDSRDDF